MTAVQAEYVRGLGGYAGGLYVLPFIPFPCFVSFSVGLVWGVCLSFLGGVVGRVGWGTAEGDLEGKTGEGWKWNEGGGGDRGARARRRGEGM